MRVRNELILENEGGSVAPIRLKTDSDGMLWLQQDDDFIYVDAADIEDFVKQLTAYMKAIK